MSESLGNGERVLVVDDDIGIVDDLVDSLRRAGFDAHGTTEPTEVLQVCARSPPDLVCCDVVMPGRRGDELMREVLASHPNQLFVLMTGFGTIEDGIEALKNGACNFIAKPFTSEQLVEKIRRSLDERFVLQRLAHLNDQPPATVDSFVHESPVMRGLVDDAMQAARTDVSVMILGESGVGKSHLARLIHKWSRRATYPFSTLNCAALPSGLAEAELFGVRRGAFTDAKSDRRGLFVSASGGTLFLDEIGELSLEVQPKLLHVLETGLVRPVGGDDEHQADTRVITATNSDLPAMVSAGRFRSDLFHRLQVVVLEVPPLRERPEDIRPLVDHLLPRIATRIGRPIGGISRDALEYLERQPWPGNIRELSNTLERAIALSRHDVLLLSDCQGPRRGDIASLHLTLMAHQRTPLSEVEQRYISEVLRVTAHNKQEAARVLGIDRRTLYRRLEP